MLYNFQLLFFGLFKVFIDEFLTFYVLHIFIFVIGWRDKIDFIKNNIIIYWFIVVFLCNILVRGGRSEFGFLRLFLGGDRLHDLVGVCRRMDSSVWIVRGFEG